MPTVLSAQRRRAIARHSQPATASLEGSADGLALLGVSDAAASLLRYFALHPDARPNVSFLRERLGVGSASLQRDLRRLTARRALERIEDGHLVRYAPVLQSKLWRAVRLLMADTQDPAPVLRDALLDVPGLDAAFVFGSMATYTTVHPGSDIDVFIVETSDVDPRALHRQLVEAGLLLGREVNAVRYTPQSLAERLGDAGQAGARFVRAVLEGPKRWIVGSADALRPLVTAAGLELPAVPAAPALNASR